VEGVVELAGELVAYGKKEPHPEQDEDQAEGEDIPGSQPESKTYQPLDAEPR
jgi:hypothetical protein